MSCDSSETEKSEKFERGKSEKILVLEKYEKDRTIDHEKRDVKRRNLHFVQTLKMVLRL